MEKPKIRFKSFEKRWESYRLSEYSNYRRGSFPQPYGNKEWYGGDNAMPFVQVVDVLENLRLVADTKQKISTLAQPMSVFVPSDSVIVTLQGSIGRVAITQYDAYVDRTILIFEDYNSQTNKEFWAYTIRNKFEIERQKAPGGTIKTITKEALSDFKVSIPEYTEQSAIGSLFCTLDDLLASYKDNLANYQSLKATMLSKMFPKTGQTVPEVRLDGFEGEWEINKLNKYLTVSKKKNNQQKFGKEDVLSVSGEVGIVNQIQFQGRSFAGVSVEMYSIVDTGNIVYTKSPLKANPYGIIKTNYGIPGIVSTLYAVYLPNENVFPGFVDRYFENDLRLNSYLKPLVNKGAKNDMKVSDENALLGNVIFPKLEEQEAISDYFTNLDKFIQSHKDKISQLETLKKKLLQDMFI